MPSFAEVMAVLIKKHGGNEAHISRELGLKGGKPRFSSQLIGQYKNGKVGKKGVNLQFVEAWKTRYGDNILDLMKGIESDNERKSRSSFKDEIFEGDYIGMHNRVWAQHELTMATQRELLKDLVKKLTNSGGDQ